MKAVVTGAAGFIGSHLIDRLLEEGWEVTGVDDFSGVSFLDASLPPIKAKMVTSSAQTYTVPSDTDVIFHLAGKVGPLGVLKHAGRIAVDTIDSADSLGRQAEDLEIPMIDISTSEVYGSPDHKNAEDDPKVFYNASARQEYAIAKLAAEAMLLNRKGLDVRIIRPFNVAGPRQRAEGGFVLPRFVQQALAGGAVTVYTPGTQRRAFTHVSDIVEGIVLAFTRGRPGEIYNLGNSDNETTIMGLAERVVAYVGGGRLVLIDPTMLHGPSFREAPDKTPNASKARRELGWQPVNTTQNIIEDVVRWEKSK